MRGRESGTGRSHFFRSAPYPGPNGFQALAPRAPSHAALDTTGDGFLQARRRAPTHPCPHSHARANPCHMRPITHPLLLLPHFVTVVPAGYLIKRGAMPLELCAAARDRLWATAESDVLKRDNPRSWVGPLPESEHGSFGPADGGNHRSGDIECEWWCAGQFYFSRNWVTEVSWHATLVAKVPKIDLQKFFRTECAGQVYNAFTYAACMAVPVYGSPPPLRSRTAGHHATAPPVAPLPCIPIARRLL